MEWILHSCCLPLDLPPTTVCIWSEQVHPQHGIQKPRKPQKADLDKCLTPSSSVRSDLLKWNLSQGRTLERFFRDVHFITLLLGTEWNHAVFKLRLISRSHFLSLYAENLQSLQWEGDTFTKSTLESAGATLFLTGPLFFTVNFSFYLRLHLSAQALWPSSPWCCMAPAQRLPAPTSLSPVTAAARPWTWGRYASVRLLSPVCSSQEAAVTTAEKR